MSDGYFYDRREWRLAREDHNFLPVWSWWAGDNVHTVRWGWWNVALFEPEETIWYAAAAYECAEHDCERSQCGCPVDMAKADRFRVILESE